MFYGRSSKYLWEMDNGEVHRIPQGEGGEQGDRMMLLLCSLGQHGVLEAANVIVIPTAAEVGPGNGVQEPLRHPHSCRKNENMGPGRQSTRDL